VPYFLLIYFSFSNLRELHFFLSQVTVHQLTISHPISLSSATNSISTCLRVSPSKYLQQCPFPNTHPTRSINLILIDLIVITTASRWGGFKSCSSALRNVIHLPLMKQILLYMGYPCSNSTVWSRIELRIVKYKASILTTETPRSVLH